MHRLFAHAKIFVHEVEQQAIRQHLERLIQEAPEEDVDRKTLRQELELLTRLTAADDKVTQAEITFTMPAPVRFDLVRVRETIALGQRIGGFTVEYWKNGNWAEFGTGRGRFMVRAFCRPESGAAGRRCWIAIAVVVALIS